MSAPLDLSSGAVFADQFEVVRPLAKGGMGAVYVVKQLGTGRERALKLMHPMLVSDERSLERFEREAKVGSEIESDHVVEVIAAGVERKSGTPWLCMELLKGETLADRIDRQGPLSREDAIEAFEQLAHALSAAHRAGIVHRDLKPENVFLAVARRQGVPFTLKVLDFGVAALVKEAAGAKTTQGVGSPMWMAPEQTDLGKVTRATDVWAVGLIAYHALTGRLYWRTPTKEGASLTALLVEIMVEPLAPPSERAAEVVARLPAGFDAWFARCVDRDPAKRFQDVGEALAQLVSMLRSGGALTPSTPPRAVPQAFEETAAAVTGPLRAPPGAARTLVDPPKRARRVWPYVLGGTLAVAGLGCGLLGWGIVSGAQSIASAGPHLTIDDGDDVVHIGPDGVEVHDEDGTTLEVGEEGAVVRLPDGGTIALAAMQPIPDEEDAEEEDDPSAEEDDEEAEDEEAEDEEAEDEEEVDDEDEAEAEEAAVPVPVPGRPLRPRASPHAAAAMPVLRSCWQANAPAGTPRTRVRLTLLVAPGGAVRNVRFEGDRDALPLPFRACVVQNVAAIHLDPSAAGEIPMFATLGAR